LTAALDDWAWIKPSADAAGRERLRLIASLADPDDWRNRFRDPALQRDRKALEALADRSEVESLPPTTVVLLARALGNVHADTKALRALRQALDRHPGDFWLNQEAGATYGRRARSATAAYAAAASRAALGYFRTALARRPDSPAAYSNLAWWVSHQGDQEEAIPLCRQAIRLQENHFPGHFVLGIALNRNGASAGAAATLMRAIELEPDHYWARLNLANACRQLGNWEAACREYRQAIRLDPGIVAGHYELALLLEQKKLWGEATTELRAAARLDRNHADAHRHLGAVLTQQGLLDEAAIVLRRAAALDRDNGHTHYCLGQLLRNNGDHEGALAAFRDSIAAYSRVAERQPTTSRALNNLAFVLATCPEESLRDGPRAMDLAKRAIELAPARANYWKTLAAAHVCAGDCRAAAGALSKSMQLRADGDWLEWFVFALGHRHGDAATAREWYARAIRFMQTRESKGDDALHALRSEAAERLARSRGTNSTHAAGTPD
jgi:tetratricopeptide (TPR) repeat protein